MLLWTSSPTLAARRGSPVFLLLLLLLLLVPGCTRLAVRGSSGLIPDLSQAVFSECDPELARASLPANLKILEGLLRADPGNRRILDALAMGFAGYAVLFVEDASSKRASALLLRAKHYGFQALGSRGRDLEAAPLDATRISGLLSFLDRKDLVPLFWASLAWSEWIRLNLDRPEAIAELNSATACLKRVIELDGSYFHGLPYAALGSVLSAIPPMLGGRPERARDLFEQALEPNGGDFLLAKLHYARYYAVRVQDRALFERLLDEILQTDPAALRDLCLLNAVARQKAQELITQTDDFFF